MSRRSSFFWAMRLAPARQRRALIALYDMLHAIDEAADGPGASDEALQIWRKECRALRQDGRPDSMEARKLAPYIRRYDLPVVYLEAVIDGCEADIRGDMHHPSREAVYRYCEQVAVAPGKLILAILGGGEREIEGLAQALGQAMQRTNMLRDRHADRRAGRHYIPYGEEAAFIAQTEAYYRQAECILNGLDRRGLLPVLLMRDIYWRLFMRLRRAHGQHIEPWSMLPRSWFIAARIVYYGTKKKGPA